MNEAFAPQYLAVEKSLNLDPSKTNVNGGAIALGHPLAGSGSRITAHLVHELRYVLEIVAFQICYLLCTCMNLGFPGTIQQVPILPHCPLPCLSPSDLSTPFSQTLLMTQLLSWYLYSCNTCSSPHVRRSHLAHVHRGPSVHVAPSLVWVHSRESTMRPVSQGACILMLLSGVRHNYFRKQSADQDAVV